MHKIKKLFIIYIVGFIVLIKTCVGEYCPVNCNKTVCHSYLTQDICDQQDGYLEIGASVCGCCPTCRSGKGFGETECNNNANQRRCSPGLTCVTSTCQLDKSDCAYTYHLRNCNLKWLPECDNKNKFVAKQCKGDKLTGRCFCYNENGNRIFGWDWRANADNMTCECSRHRAQLESSGRTDVTLHCSQNGNYDALQCDSGICWCADSKTGDVILGTRVVSADQWTLLPCYDAKTMGTQYLRKCESAAFAQDLILKQLAKRGTKNLAHTKILCDYDGSYGTYGVQDKIAFCTLPDGSRAGAYGVEEQNTAGMNCYCARDKEFFTEAGYIHSINCAGNGNYDPLQHTGNQAFCVDSDGFAVTDYMDGDQNIDCNDFLYDSITQPC